MSSVDQSVAAHDWPPHGPSRARAPRTRAVPNTPQARRHAEHATRIREWLREMGVCPEVVAPTRDGRGHVRLNFDQVERLLFENEDKES